MCTHQLSSGRRPPALGGTTVGQLGVQGPPLRAEPGGEGLSRLHPRSPAPWSHLHACHPMDDTLALGDGPGRKGRDSGTCAQNMGPRAWSASAHGSGSPPTSRGSAPRGADAGRSRARARPGPVCRRLSTDGVGHSTGGSQAQGAPGFRVTLALPQACSWPSCCITAASLAFSRGTCSTVRRASTGSPEGGLSRGLEAARRLKRGAEDGGPGSGRQGGNRRVPATPAPSP